MKKSIILHCFTFVTDQPFLTDPLHDLFFDDHLHNARSPSARISEVLTFHRNRNTVAGPMLYFSGPPHVGRVPGDRRSPAEWTSTGTEIQDNINNRDSHLIFGENRAREPH